MKLLQGGSLEAPGDEATALRRRYEQLTGKGWQAFGTDIPKRYVEGNELPVELPAEEKVAILTRATPLAPLGAIVGTIHSGCRI